MDQTGTMTPPHDHDADTAEFAPVIPLRRRQHGTDSPGATQTLETDRPGIWDPDAPLAGLTQRPSALDQQTTDPLERPVAPADGPAERGDPSMPVARRRARAGSHRLVRRRGQIATGCAVLAATAAVLALAAPAGRPHATRSSTVTLPGAHGEQKIHAARPHTTLSDATIEGKPRARRLAAKHVAHSRPARNPTRKLRTRAVTVATTVQTPEPVVVSDPPPTGRPPANTTPPAHTQTASIPHHAGQSRSAASQCVPGELGC